MIEKYAPDIVKITAERIDLIRSQREFTYRELSKRSGVSLATIHNIIQGKKIPNIFTIDCICKALNISLSDLFDSDDNAIRLRGKESIVIKIYREISPMSQDTVIKILKCMK